MHLLLNLLSLVMASAFLESLIGARFLPALLLVSTLGGSALSMVINPPQMISVGASSAIMGLLAAAVILASRLPEKERSQAQLQLGRVLVPSLIPLATTRMEGNIDFAGHFGGAIAGGIFGWLLLRSWPDDSGRLPLTPRLRTSSLVAALLFGVAALQAGRVWPRWRHLSGLVPSEEFSAARKSSDSQAAYAKLIETHPHDPRLLAMRGEWRHQHGDLEGAESDVRAALAEEGALQVVFSEALTQALHGELALVLKARGRLDEAKAEAAPICLTKSQIVPGLREAQLCGP
jgi:rhomboid protease GluP